MLSSEPNTSPLPCLLELHRPCRPCRPRAHTSSFLVPIHLRSVDVYSFAMIFFYMVSGRPPFMNMDGLEAVKAAAMEKKRPELPRLRPLSPALAELLTSTWCSEASERLTFDVVSVLACETAHGCLPQLEHAA
eukprot:scaffold173664_cov33-Tisochrysis_lutea.AAC.4